MHVYFIDIYTCEERENVSKFYLDFFVAVTI